MKATIIIRPNADMTLDDIKRSTYNWKFQTLKECRVDKNLSIQENTCNWTSSIEATSKLEWSDICVAKFEQHAQMKGTKKRNTVTSPIYQNQTKVSIEHCCMQKKIMFFKHQLTVPKKPTDVEQLL